jgi:sorting nexin-1/2
VSRRFRDFLWLYNQLHNNNPGVIVPPPPEKQAVGRFNADFVESRRQSLERMLNKIAAHSTLQLDGDLKLFLESDAFNVDIKHKERREPLVGESKGMLSNLGIGPSTTKFVEHDDVSLKSVKDSLDCIDLKLNFSGSMIAASIWMLWKISSKPWKRQ